LTKEKKKVSSKKPEWKSNVRKINLKKVDKGKEKIDLRRNRSGRLI